MLVSHKQPKSGREVFFTEVIGIVSAHPVMTDSTSKADVVGMATDYPVVVKNPSSTLGIDQTAWIVLLAVAPVGDFV